MLVTLPLATNHAWSGGLWAPPSAAPNLRTSLSWAVAGLIIPVLDGT